MKTFRKCVVFLLILYIILFILSIFFVPKNNTIEAGFPEHSDLAIGIYAEPVNSIDVLVIGDSEAYSSYIPLENWNKYGYTSYVVSTPAQALATTISYTYNALKTQSPKYVLFEVNTLYRRKKFKEPIYELAGRFLPILHYHDRWKSLKPEDFTGKVNYTEVLEDKGYYYLTYIRNGEKEDYMQETTSKSKIPKANELYVKFIKKMCEDKGAELIMYSAPSTKNWSYAKHNGIVEFAKKLGVEYIDLNLKRKEVPINWRRESRDDGDHVNYDGAVKVTKYLGEYLHNKNTLPDHRNDEAYSSWNECYKNYIERVKEDKASADYGK